MPELLPTTADETAPVARLRDGTTIRLEREIDRGAFGTVHACAMGSAAAVAKVLRIDPDDTRYAGARERMRTEEACLRDLETPGVPRLLGTGDVGGQTCIILERVEGASWRKLLREMPRNAFPWPILLSLAHSCAQALDSVHDAGIAHGDIKPENVLLGKRRNDARRFGAWIVDFGLARRMETASTRLTSEGNTLGTHGYLDPSTIGRAQERGPASDIFALGSTLAEAWRGQPLFPPEHWRRILSDPSCVTDAVRETLRPLWRRERRWSALLASMLAELPERRPSAAEAVSIMRSLGGGHEPILRVHHPCDPKALAEALMARPRGTRTILAVATGTVLGLAALLLSGSERKDDQRAHVAVTELETPQLPPRLQQALEKARAGKTIVQSKEIDIPHAVHLLHLTTEELCMLLDEGKPGLSAGLPKRKEYPACLYRLRPDAADEESLLQLTRGCWHVRGGRATFHRTADLDEPGGGDVRTFLGPWKRLDTAADHKELQRANDHLRELKKAAGIAKP